jgi:GNAT superfamily N-acetyltransferase
LSEDISIQIVDPASPDARWCLEQYFAELDQRFDHGFDPGLSIPAQAEELKSPLGLFLIAYKGNNPVGCGALKFHETGIAELKRMWVALEARGLGLGRRILKLLEQHAKDSGMTVIHLETNNTLKEAIQLYRDSGYREVEAFNDDPYAQHWFEKRF